MPLGCLPFDGPTAPLTSVLRHMGAVLHGLATWPCAEVAVRVGALPGVERASREGDGGGNGAGDGAVGMEAGGAGAQEGGSAGDQQGVGQGAGLKGGEEEAQAWAARHEAWCGLVGFEGLRGALAGMMAGARRAAAQAQCTGVRKRSAAARSGAEELWWVPVPLVHTLPNVPDSYRQLLSAPVGARRSCFSAGRLRDAAMRLAGADTAAAAAASWVDWGEVGRLAGGPVLLSELVGQLQGGEAMEEEEANEDEGNDCADEVAGAVLEECEMEEGCTAAAAVAVGGAVGATPGDGGRSRGGRHSDATLMVSNWAPEGPHALGYGVSGEEQQCSCGGAAGGSASGEALEAGMCGAAVAAVAAASAGPDQPHGQLHRQQHPGYPFPPACLLVGPLSFLQYLLPQRRQRQAATAIATAAIVTDHGGPQHHVPGRWYCHGPHHPHAHAGVGPHPRPKSGARSHAGQPPTATTANRLELGALEALKIAHFRALRSAPRPPHADALQPQPNGNEAAGPAPRGDIPRPPPTTSATPRAAAPAAPPARHPTPSPPSSAPPFYEPLPLCTWQVLPAPVPASLPPRTHAPPTAISCHAATPPPQRPLSGPLLEELGQVLQAHGRLLSLDNGRLFSRTELEVREEGATGEGPGGSAAMEVDTSGKEGESQQQQQQQLASGPVVRASPSHGRGWMDWLRPRPGKRAKSGKAALAAAAAAAAAVTEGDAAAAAAGARRQYRRALPLVLERLALVPLGAGRWRALHGLLPLAWRLEGLVGSHEVLREVLLPGG